MRYGPIPEENIRFLDDVAIESLLATSAADDSDYEKVYLFCIRVRRPDSEAGAWKEFYYQFMKDAEDGLAAERELNRISTYPLPVEAHCVNGRYYLRKA